MINVALANKLCSWLDATTNYAEPKENLIRKPNHERSQNKWRPFYSYGPMLVMDKDSVLDADGNPTSVKLEIKAVSHNRGVQPGEIIESGNGRKYIVQPNGSIRKI